MRNVELHILCAELMPCEELLRDVGHPADGEFKDIFAVLMDVMHFLFNSFCTGRMKTATGRHIQELPAVAVATQDKVDNSALAVFTGFH